MASVSRFTDILSNKIYIYLLFIQLFYLFMFIDLHLGLFSGESGQNRDFGSKMTL